MDSARMNGVSGSPVASKSTRPNGCSGGLLELLTEILYPIRQKDVYNSKTSKLRNRQVPFTGKILILGCGAVARCALPIIPRLIKVPLENITMVDMVDNREMVKDYISKGVKYFVEKIDRTNLRTMLSTYLKSGDFLVDLAWEIDTLELLDFCRERNVMYVNASLEIWEPYDDVENKKPTELTLYHRHAKLRERIRQWGSNGGATAIIDHGANPGLVSHLVKQGLEDIANKVVADNLVTTEEAEKIKAALGAQEWPRLAMLLNVKVIHISERDLQITNKPKQRGEFVNTWSCRGFYEEGVAPAELGWGTHEKQLPKGAFEHHDGPKNQICLASKGMNTRVRSMVPAPQGAGAMDILGMVIRHGEAFTISDRLTVRDDAGKPLYRPTVHYAYSPTDAAMNSLEELRMRHFDMQDRMRILGDDIVQGEDVLGVLLMGHPLKSWWIGSQLDINEARTLVPHQNATTVQVAISLVAAMQWAIENPKSGVLVPDDLPHRPLLEACKPYLGPFVSSSFDWTPAQGLAKEEQFKYGSKPELPTGDDVWQFETFVAEMERA